MNEPSPQDLRVTRDAFLGGRLNILQPARGFRSGLDAVLLASAVPASSGERALEAGMGVGVASLCLAWRVEGLEVTGLEIDRQLVALARENAACNGLADRVEAWEGNVDASPDELRLPHYDQVFTNPPFLEEGQGLPAEGASRSRARMGSTGTLARWVSFCLRQARPGARVTFLHRADKLGTLLSLLEGRLGAMTVVPLWPRAGVAAKRVIVSGRTVSRVPLSVLPGLVLHEIDGRFTPAAEAILRDGAPLPLA